MARRAKLRVALHERVPRFEHRILQSLLGQGFHVSSIVLSPIDLGTPSSRPRRYSAADHTPSVDALAELNAFNLLPLGWW